MSTGHGLPSPSSGGSTTHPTVRTLDQNSELTTGKLFFFILTFLPSLYNYIFQINLQVTGLF